MIKRREEAQFAILGAVVESDVPLGTRDLHVALVDKGFDLSESSTARLLRELDERGWTVPLGSKGRVSTTAGRHAWNERLNVSTAAGHGLDVRDLEDLLDLLSARKVVESAIAEEAARTATAEDVQELRDLASRHHSAVGGSGLVKRPGLQIHRKIASISSNKIMHALSNILLAPTFDRVESVLDVVIGANEEQSAVASHHDIIIDAIEARDEARARQLMAEHFDTMIADVRRHVEMGNGNLVARLLQWADTADTLN